MISGEKWKEMSASEALKWASAWFLNFPMVFQFVNGLIIWLEKLFIFLLCRVNWALLATTEINIIWILIGNIVLSWRIWITKILKMTIINKKCWSWKISLWLNSQKTLWLFRKRLLGSNLIKKILLKFKNLKKLNFIKMKF